MHPTFPFLPGLLSRNLLSKVPPRSAHSPESFQAILSCQIDEFLFDLSVKTDDIQPLHQKVLLALCVVLQIVFHTAYSRLPGSLGHFADSNSIPKSLTITFHPVLTVAILLTYLPLLVGRLLQRCQFVSDR